MSTEPKLKKKLPKIKRVGAWAIFYKKGPSVDAMEYTILKSRKSALATARFDGESIKHVTISWEDK